MAQRRDLDSTGGRQANNNKYGYLNANEDPRYGGGMVIESSKVEEVSMSPLAEMIAILNDVKAQLNAHVDVEGSVHDTDLSATAISTADATDEATAYTLANALKALFNAHVDLGVGAGHPAGADTANEITTAAATTTALLCTMAEELKTDYEAHRVLITTEAHTAADSTNDVTAADYGAKTCATAVFPANSIGLGVCTYVKEGMATAVNFDVGISGDATRFGTNELDTVDKADNNPGDAWDRYTSETAVILTPDARPTTVAGKILVQTHYIRLLPLHKVV